MEDWAAWSFKWEVTWQCRRWRMRCQMEERRERSKKLQALIKVMLRAASRLRLGAGMATCS
eukprot:4831219-Amphidinium_carterae.1